MTMDIWTDPNNVRYMATTAHWIEATNVNAATGAQYHLNLRSDLIGFTYLEGSHTDENLSDEFILVLDHLRIADKVSRQSLSTMDFCRTEHCSLDIQSWDGLH